MDDQKFWQIVQSGIPPEPYTRLQHFEKLDALLRGLSKVELKDFVMLLNIKINEAYRWDLWAVAFIIRDRFNHYGCSDDSFYAFRAALVSHGPDVFSLAINNPDELANFQKIENCKNFDDFAYLAVNAYNELYGDLDFNPYTNQAVKPQGKEWSDDDVQYLCATYPKCVERWGPPDS